MWIHRASTLDVERFTEDVGPLVAALDLRDIEPLRLRAIEVSRRIWAEANLAALAGEKEEGLTVLRRHGEDRVYLPKEIEGINEPSPREIGKLLVLMLEDYAAPCASAGANWSVLYSALRTLDWMEQDAKLLFHGHPAHLLLKPDQRAPIPEYLHEDMPFWFWFSPGRSRAGWLGFEDVAMLHTKLAAERNALEQYDFGRYPEIDSANPVVVREYGGYLKSASQDTLAMLESALEARRGLYMTLLP